MEVTTFAADMFDLSTFAERLEKFIEVEHAFIEGSLVVALSSKFGTGKTTFLKMWKERLDKREDDTNGPLVIALNAWESDYYGDPLFAIISALAASLQSTEQSAETLINAAKDVGWFATAIGGQVVRKLTGIDAVAAGDLAEKKRAKRGEPKLASVDAFSVYEGRKDAMRRLQTSIREFVAASNSRVLFLVDELDRCRPDYAITYLETIKHIFDVKGATFVLAADRDQLENSAKTAFGPDLDFEEYYRKFIHREVSLPPISDSGYTKLASSYVTRYLQRDDVRNCFMKIESHDVDRIVDLVASMKMTPRQIQEMFRILGHVFETAEEDRGRLLWCIGVGTVVMAAFKVGNPKVFRLLGSQQFEPPDAVALLTDLFGDRHVDWWFTLFLTGNGLKVGENVTAQELMTQVGLLQDGQESGRLEYIGQWHQGWGHSTGRFKQIYEKIEYIAQWN
ncbi:hypothetical protein GC176_18845 [bacterium]|nr:hypothetical protein [bacterium]